MSEERCTGDVQCGPWDRADEPDGDALEDDDILLRLLRGDDAHLRSELLRRFRGTGTGHATQLRRTVGQLLAAAQTRWAERQRLARERQAAARKRQEQAAAAAREQRLNALAGRQDQGRQRVAAMIETKKPKEYDAAVALLADLKALAERDGGTAVFNHRVQQLRQQHARKPSLLDRLDRARIG